MIRAMAVWTTITATFVMSVGCSTGQQVHSLEGFRSYPAQKVQAEVLDIQLIRDGAEISLTNTSARAFGETTLWLNQEFSYVIDGIAVGQTVRLDLSEFRNHHGAYFRAGGFFATERPKNVVLAQLELGEDAQSLLGIVVVNGQATR
ncbi:MAG: hypothetical protein ACF8MJ_03615 [Phycisphaerales bacterium JB050]